jgi:biotin carboxyl carrier protein
MLKIRVNKDKYIEYKQEKGQIIIDEHPFPIDIESIGSTKFHLLRGTKSYSAELIKFDPQSKNLTLKIEGEKFEVSVQDRFDLLMEKMGINQSAGIKAENIKAPMPGLILDIKISEGQEVDLGEPLLILEAMKMENILKSPTKGIIKSIKVKKGQSVEKNHVLIEF